MQQWLEAEAGLTKHKLAVCLVQFEKNVVESVEDLAELDEFELESVLPQVVLRSQVRKGLQRRLHGTPEASAVQLAGTQLVYSTGETAGNDTLRGKTVGIYFSGHWCPPCRTFTPKLLKRYNNLKSMGDETFEVVFVGNCWTEAGKCAHSHLSGCTPEDFSSYFSKMPWLAVPYTNRRKAKELEDAFNVHSAPCLVIVAADGTILNYNAKEQCEADSRAQLFPWAAEKEDKTEKTTKAPNHDKYDLKKMTPRVVAVTMRVFAIDDIDPISQRFTCEFFANFSWRDDNFSAFAASTKTNGDGDGDECATFDEHAQWMPKITFANMREELHSEHWFRIDAAKTAEDRLCAGPRINMRLRKRAIFTEVFELHDSPFDCQGKAG